MRAPDIRYNNELFDESTPKGMAYKLAKNITDVGAIRSYVLGFFGEEKTPSRETIADFIAYHRRPARGDAFANRTLGYYPETDDGQYRPEPTAEVLREARKQARRKTVEPFTEPRQRDYIVIEAANDENPWLHPWRMSRCLIESICRDLDLDVRAVLGQRKTISLVKARFVVYKLLTEWGYSSSEVGHRAGGRDHSTVLHGLKQFQVHYERDPRIAATYDRHKALMLEAIEQREAA